MFAVQDLLLIVFLAFLEGILSIDNALVLAMIAKHLPKSQQRKALTYGIFGSVVFRLIALSFATWLIQMSWVKLVGGAYLVTVAGRHFLRSEADLSEKRYKKMSFVHTVILIELMDIAFAVDSILAAVAMSPKFWVVFIAGMMGVVMMRFAATLFIRVLERMPNLETTAFLMIAVIGTKVTLEGLKIEILEFERLGSPAFFVFWGAMALCLLYGVLTPKRD